MKPPAPEWPNNPTERDRQPLARLGRPYVMAATLGPEERAAILEAIEQAGLKRPATGCRAILMAFARSAEVRDGVARWVRTHPEVL